jgi:hypothetical protein
MCLVSDKIKFCTCVGGSVKKLEHYWILYRFDKEKNEMYMGMPTMPTSMSDFNYKENQATLLVRLNESDAFDVPMHFKEKDILEIVINNTPDIYEPFIYSFRYNKGKWLTEETDPFEIMNHFDEEKNGKIKNALKSIRKK